MKKLQLLTLVLLMSAGAALAQCSAHFITSQALPNDPFIIAFTDSSIGITPNAISYWDFGDGTNDSTNGLASINHTYASAGWYYACLTVDYNGCASTYCDTITVGNSGGGCFGAFAYTQVSGTTTVDFVSTGNGVPPFTYSWDFGDGIGSSAQALPSYTYNSPGMYGVFLVMQDAAGCSVTSYDTVIVTGSNNCGVGFQHTGLPVSGGAQITFTSSINGTVAPVSYLWDFGDNTTGTSANPTHTYPTGTYSACLTISDAAGCTSTFCDTIIVGSGGGNCGVGFQFTTQPSALGEFADFTVFPNGTAPFAYHWTFGDGDSSNLANPSHNYLTGNYTACVTITDATGCTSTFCDAVVIGANNNNCYASFMYSVDSTNGVQFYDSSSQGINTTYLWDLGDGSISTLAEPFHQYAPGFYYVCLTITQQASPSGPSCTSTHCDSLFVGSNSGNCAATFVYSQTTIGQTFQFASYLSGYLNPQYYWDFGDSSFAYSANPLHQFNQAGTYTVCLYVFDQVFAPGCADTICQTITVAPANGPFSISGVVTLPYANTIANGAPGYPAVIYLIVKDSLSLTAIDSTFTTPNGYYIFNNVAPGSYLVKAALTPGSNVMNTYLPTYFGDQLFWFNAATIVANQNHTGKNINMIAGLSPGGPGFVGGLISQGANKQGPGDPVANIAIMLLNMDNSPVQYTVSDADGLFEMDDIAYGTYQVYAEVAGKPTIPVIVTIGPDTESFADLNIIVESNKVTSTTTTTGIEEILINNTKFYPNPTADRGTLSFSLEANADVNIEVINQLGQVVHTVAANLTTGQQMLEVDLHSQPQGMYILLLHVNDKPAVYQRVLKQ